MAEIVITEFMDECAVRDGLAGFDVVYDPELVDRPVDLIKLASNARALIVRNRTQVRGALLDAARELRAVGRLGVGLDNIDAAACEARGIAVLPATGANDAAVAEYVICSAMMLLRGAYFATPIVLTGAWPRNASIGREIAGRTLGLIGFGAIARETAKRAAFLGMRVAAYDPYAPEHAFATFGVVRRELAPLLAEADVVSLHVPLTDATRCMMSAERIAAMRSGAILINAARGGVVDEPALVAALRERRLGGAALDVFAEEPLSAERASIFANVPNLMLTPHIAGVTEEFEYPGVVGNGRKRTKGARGMTTMSIAAATEWVAAAFARKGCDKDNAMAVARALVAAEADGLKGHGLSRLPTYFQMLHSGKIDGRARARASRPRAGVLAIDAAYGFAYPALELAIDELPALAAAQGVAVAAISRSNHCGAAGLPCEALARKGLVALFFANTPGGIAPWGGRTATFGTNPIAFSAPLAGRDPPVVDMALSKVARGPIVAAKQRGEAIPDDWALDSEGRPTTDAAKAIEGTMLPLGGAKGAALAFMVEILAACLPGANLAFEASSFLDGKGPPPATGQILIAFDPAAFGHAGFGERLAALARAIEEQPGARLPGARRLANRAHAQKNEIVITAEVEAAAQS